MMILQFLIVAYFFGVTLYRLYELLEIFCMLLSLTLFYLGLLTLR